MKAIGLDIGTTTICGVVIDGESGEVLFSRTLSNDSGYAQGSSLQTRQRPEKIWESIVSILEEMEKVYSQVESIGITGQMHGILYIDKEGRAVSPLYTWQDESGNEIWKTENGKTFAAELSEITKYPMASGYGLTTCFYHVKKDGIPQGAEGICTIADYIGMKLTGEKTPVISPSNAAGIGLFDIENNCFMHEEADRAGIPQNFLPEVKRGFEITGKVKQKPYKGTPVSIGIGDNQASIIGSVKDMSQAVLVNVGTGSQISVVIKEYKKVPGVELRPLTGKSYVLAGACLCGGRAYAALENFFRQVCHMVDIAPSSLYDKMNEFLKEDGEKCSYVTVDPRFCGTRDNPSVRGSIGNISLENFTPASFTKGVLYGIAGELMSFYRQMKPVLKEKRSLLTGSGNGLRKNMYLRKIFEEMFESKMNIPVHKEEASYGAALFSLVSAGYYKTLPEAQKIIRYL